MRLVWRPQASMGPRPLNVGVVVAVLLGTLTAGFIGGFIVWAVWRYDLLQLSDRRDQA
jgi:uncharacterized protein (DUF2062 family)